MVLTPDQVQLIGVALVVHFFLLTVIAVNGWHR